MNNHQEIIQWAIKNNISEELLPRNEEELSNLTILDLYRLGLTELPQSIGKLSQLKELNLNDNKLTTLPESIKNLKQLKEISLSDNEFTDLTDIIEILPIGLKQIFKNYICLPII